MRPPTGETSSNETYRRIVILTVVTAFVTLGVGQANAAEPASPDATPEGTYVSGFTVENSAAESSTLRSSTLLGTATASCKTVYAWRGFWLWIIQTYAWKYFLRISWCYNGSKITSLGYTRWGEVYVPTWDFKGHIGFSASGGVGSWSARRWTQGKFQQCAEFCVQTKTPWVELLVRANGTWAYAAGG